MDLARRLIDELQSREITSASKSKLPRVPGFEQEEGNRKLSAVEMLGSSDSQAVLECNPKLKRKVKHNCYQRYHPVKKISIMQGQRELAKKLEEVD